jgi:glutathione synthase
MDHIDDIKYAKDTTLAMLLAAQQRGYELLYLTQPDLYLRDGVARGRARPLRVFADPARWFELGEAVDLPLGGVDVILMRKDPPFDMEFIYTTYILDRAELAGALVVNRPAGLRDMNEKVYTAWFPQFCAPTLVTRDMQAMAAFAVEHERIVVKPLHGMGGRSIFVVDRNDKNLNVVFETLTEYGSRFAIAQPDVPLLEIVETPAAPARGEEHRKGRILVRLDVLDRIHHEADLQRRVAGAHAQWGRSRALRVTVVMVSELGRGGFAINMLKPRRERNPPL